MEPNDTGSYFALVRIYQDAGKVEDAEEILKQAQAAAPDKTDVWSTSAQFYNRKGEFDRAMESLPADHPDRAQEPAELLPMAVSYEEKVHKDFTLNPQRRWTISTRASSRSTRPSSSGPTTSGADLQGPAVPAAGGLRRTGQAGGADAAGRRDPEEGAGRAELQNKGARAAAAPKK